MEKGIVYYIGIIIVIIIFSTSIFKPFVSLGRVIKRILGNKK